MTQSPPKLPCLYFVRAGKYTYVRTYSSKWEQMPNGRMGSIKRNIKTVGRIDSSSGLGEVHFKAEFLTQYPELNCYRVTRQTSESRQGGHQLIFTPKTATAGTAATTIPAAEDHTADPEQEDGCFVKSIGPFLLCRQLLDGDPLLSALQECFDQRLDLMLSAALYLLLEPDNTLEHIYDFSRDMKLFVPGEIETVDLAALFASIDEQQIEKFFKVYYRKLKDGFYKRRIVQLRYFSSYSRDKYQQLMRTTPLKNGESGESLPALNVDLIAEPRSLRPLFYQIQNGSQLVYDSTFVFMRLFEEMGPLNLNPLELDDPWKIGQQILHAFATLKQRMHLGTYSWCAEVSLCGKSFVQFIALSIYCLMAAAVKQHKARGRTLPHQEISQLLSELRAIKEIYSPAAGTYQYTTLTKAQQKTLKIFGIELPPVHPKA